MFKGYQKKMVVKRIDLSAQEGLSKVQTKFAPQWIILNQNQGATGLIHELIKPWES